MNIELRQLDKTSLSEQLVVYRAAFSPVKDLEEYKIIWKRKHYENPLGDSLVFGAYCDGKLVGMNSYMPVQYTFQGKVIPLLQSCESGVLPEYQGRGIWSKVVRYAIEFIFRETDYHAVIGFPNFINSYPGFKKMGWETLFNMDNYVLVNNARQFANNVIKGNIIKRFLGHLSFLQRILVTLYGAGFRRYIIGECDSDDLLWEARTDVMSITHSNELLAWKKAYKGIKTIAITRNNKVLASCIFSLGDYNGTRIIKIEKCNISDKAGFSLKKAIALFCKFFLKEYPEVSFLRVWTMPKSDKSIALKSLLFVKSSHINPFIIKQPYDVFLNKSWDMSFFDLD